MQILVLRVALVAASFVIASSSFAFADDEAVSVAVGGIIPQRETRIVMAKEVLAIDKQKITVDYDFRNDSPIDVTTEVAFPVPRYFFNYEERPPSALSFADFKLEIDGKPTPFATEVKATLKGKDVTGVLTGDNIDIASCGHFNFQNNGTMLIPDFERLPKSEQQKLVARGLFDDVSGGGQRSVMCMWGVDLAYHWRQVFPAHAIVHIRHEYTPVIGFHYVQLQAIKRALDSTPTGKKTNTNPLQDVDVLQSFCPTRPFLEDVRQRLEADDPIKGQYTYPSWVDFILTSANTWKKPIEDFTLIVDRPQPADQNLISFCSPGKIDASDPDHMQVHLTDFIPAAELHIGFFGVPPSPAAKP